LQTSRAGENWLSLRPKDVNWCIKSCYKRWKTFCDRDEWMVRSKKWKFERHKKIFSHRSDASQQRPALDSAAMLPAYVLIPLFYFFFLSIFLFLSS
jgi:hypothetical protein